jgi:hypothetical protein
MRLTRSVAIALAAAQGLSACYRYTPILATPADAGTDVRLQLTDQGSLALGPAIGPQVETMDGRLVSIGDTSFVLSVQQTENRAGLETSWRGERVTVPRSSVARVERRELAKGRSWAVGGLAVAAVVAIGRAVNLAGSGGSRGGSGSGHTQ